MTKTRCTVIEEGHIAAVMQIQLLRDEEAATPYRRIWVDCSTKRSGCFNETLQSASIFGFFLSSLLKAGKNCRAEAPKCLLGCISNSAIIYSPDIVSFCAMRCFFRRVALSVEGFPTLWCAMLYIIPQERFSCKTLHCPVIPSSFNESL